MNEEDASELLENDEEMFYRYNMNDVLPTGSNPEPHAGVTGSERVN